MKIDSFTSIIVSMALELPFSSIYLGCKDDIFSFCISGLKILSTGFSM